MPFIATRKTNLTSLNCHFTAFTALHMHPHAVTHILRKVITAQCAHHRYALSHLKFKTFQSILVTAPALIS